MEFIGSSNIKAFPASYRGADSSGRLYDAESALTTEGSLRTLSFGRFSKHSSVRFDYGANSLVITVAGYTFTVSGSGFSDVVSKITGLFSPLSNTSVYAAVRIASVDTSVAGSLYGFQQLQAVSASTTGEALDGATGLFYGLGFTQDEPSASAEEGETDYVKVLEYSNGSWSIPEASGLITDSTQVENYGGQSLRSRVDTGEVVVSASGTPSDEGPKATVSADSLTLEGSSGRGAISYADGTGLSIESDSVSVSAGDSSVSAESESASISKGSTSIEVSADGIKAIGISHIDAGDMNSLAQASDSSLHSISLKKTSEVGEDANSTRVVSSISQDSLGRIDGFGVRELPSAGLGQSGLMTADAQSIYGFKSFAESSSYKSLGNADKLTTLQQLFAKASGGSQSGVSSDSRWVVEICLASASGNLETWRLTLGHLSGGYLVDGRTESILGPNGSQAVDSNGYALSAVVHCLTASSISIGDVLAESSQYRTDVRTASTADVDALFS